jgi:hypothetical protein
VFERSPRGTFGSDRQLIFLGRLPVSPVLFLGATGYFAYLADRGRFRSAVLSELKHIMAFASLDNTYHIEDWFMTKSRLFVHVAKKGQRVGRRFDLPYRRLLSRLGRRLPRLL